ncbi:hypothetical protein ACEPAG_3336 [Sanghuangporus baumii]
MLIHYVAVVGTENVHGVFHFRFSLVSQKSNTEFESVRIDMQPDFREPDFSMRGFAQIEYKPYSFSWNSGPRPFVKPVRPGMTVGMLLNIIFDRHELDKYIFVQPGLGCRHWCACVLDRLAGDGVIDANVSQEFANREIEEHGRFGWKFPMPRIMGSFYH